MDELNIDTKASVYLLTELPDGCPAIILQHPYADKATQVQVVAVFANSERGHELAETVCELKNDTFSPYLKTLIETRDNTAQAVQDAAINILERMGTSTKEGGAE